MDDEYPLEVFDTELVEDIDQSARIADVSIPDLIAIISKLMPMEEEAETEILSEWLVPDFRLYDQTECYDPDKWELIGKLAQNLLFKRILLNFKAGILR